MKRIGVFADVSNLYYCVNKKFNSKLDYEKYYDWIKPLGEIQQAVAYGAQMDDKAEGFIYALKKIGFYTKYKTPKTYVNNDIVRRKADWDVGIAIDIVTMIDKIDMIVLGTADGDLCPVVEWSLAKGADVIILACGISKDLKEIATKWVEIPESMLEDKDE